MAPRRRWLLQPLSWRRGGAVALIVLTLVAAAALMLDADAGGEYAPIVDRLSRSHGDPAEQVVELGRGAQILILSDIHGRAAPKRVAAETIRRLAAGPGLDGVVLEVPSSEQPYIDAFLAGAGEATSLMSRPAAVHEWQGVAREYAGIYEAIRAVNDSVSPSRRIRVIAADLDDWPPPRGSGPRGIGELYGQRAEHMLSRLDRELFSIMPEARVLVFVDGYLTLQRTHGAVRYGGGEPERVEWLGELLRRRSGSAARTVLLDAGSGTPGVQRLPSYHGTGMHRALRRELSQPAGVRVTQDLGRVTDPILGLETPGLRLDVLPEGYTFGDIAHGYIFLPGGR